MLLWLVLKCGLPVQNVLDFSHSFSLGNLTWCSVCTTVDVTKCAYSVSMKTRYSQIPPKLI